MIVSHLNSALGLAVRSTQSRKRGWEIRVALSPVALPPHKTVRGVQFAMLDGTALVIILVSQAALLAIERSPAGTGDYLTRFQKHRSAFEEIASNKHTRGQIEENGSIIIQQGDR